MKSLAPTVAAVVREQTGLSWSRARNLCSEGRVTADGERCLDPATRISPDAIVAVNERGPKLAKGPLAKSGIVFFDRDLVVVDKPAGMLTVADEPGNKDTLVEYTRTLLRRMGGSGNDAALSGATLVECRLETGRQHQIRIHMSELGHPLVGERVYIRDYAGARIEAPRTMLHARALGFAHPRSGERVSFEREAPQDFRAMLELLQG